MHYIAVLFLFILSSITFAYDSDVIKTKYGNIQIKENGDNEEYLDGFFFRNSLLYKSEVHLGIEKVFHIKNNEVVLIEETSGGSGSISTYFFITLTSGTIPIISGKFERDDFSIIEPVQIEDKIVVDLGYNSKKQRTKMIYQDGNISIQKLNVKVKNNRMNKDDCTFLYEDIYLDYINKQKCGEDPTSVLAQSVVRPYAAIHNTDPYFKAAKFSSLLQYSCKKRSRLKYSEFKESICGGKVELD